MKRHPFFKRMDWERLRAGLLQPPYAPLQVQQLPSDGWQPMPPTSLPPLSPPVGPSDVAAVAAAHLETKHGDVSVVEMVEAAPQTGARKGMGLGKLAVPTSSMCAGWNVVRAHAYTWEVVEGMLLARKAKQEGKRDPEPNPNAPTAPKAAGSCWCSCKRLLQGFTGM